jgi:hypothetical protein
MTDVRPQIDPASALSRAVVGVAADGSSGEARGWSVHAGIVFADARARVGRITRFNLRLPVPEEAVVMRAA